MTMDDETTSLIEEARHLLASNQWTTGWAESLADRLLDALEAARAARDAEVEELRAERDRLRDAIGAADRMAESYDKWALRALTAEATLAKVRGLAENAELDIYERERLVLADDLFAILDESPTERETFADEWEYGHEYTHMDGSPYRRRVSYEVFREHAPDGHRADGSPYWNYRQLRRRKAGPWEVVPDDRA